MNIHFYDRPIPVYVELKDGRVFRTEAIANRESDSWVNMFGFKRYTISFLVKVDGEYVWVAQDQILSEDRTKALNLLYNKETCEPKQQE